MSFSLLLSLATSCSFYAEALSQRLTKVSMHFMRRFNLIEERVASYMEGSGSDMPWVIFVVKFSHRFSRIYLARASSSSAHKSISTEGTRKLANSGDVRLFSIIDTISYYTGRGSSKN